MPKPSSIPATLAEGFLAFGLAVHGAEKPTPSLWGDFVEADFPFCSSVVAARKLGDGLPADNLTPRALVLNLGHDCWVAFDPELLRVSGVKAQEGQSKLPQIVGGTKAAADEASLRESIKEPAAKVGSGFEKNPTGMPSSEGIVTKSQIEALILSIQSLK